MPFEQSHQVVGLEDSRAGVCSICLVGFTPIGVAGGNIIESGTQALCGYFSHKKISQGTPHFECGGEWERAVHTAHCLV